MKRVEDCAGRTVSLRDGREDLTPGRTRRAGTSRNVDVAVSKGVECFGQLAERPSVATEGVGDEDGHGPAREHELGFKWADRRGKELVFASEGVEDIADHRSVKLATDHVEVIG